MVQARQQLGRGQERSFVLDQRQAQVKVQKIKLAPIKQPISNPVAKAAKQGKREMVKMLLQVVRQAESGLLLR